MIGDQFHKKRLVDFGGEEKYWGSGGKNRPGVETDEGGHTGRFPTDLLEFPITKSNHNQAKTYFTTLLV